MSVQRKKYSAEIKARVALEAIRGLKTAVKEALIASFYQQIGQLKVQVDWLEKKSKPLH